MALEQVRRTTVGDTVVDRLRAEIVEGRWRVGDRIPPEPELMAALGVARGTLREALRSLQYTGLIEIRRGDGTFVRSRSEMSGAVERSSATIEQVLEAQAIVEPQIARLAALRATDAQIEVIREALARRATAEDDEAWLTADVDVHEAVALAVDNPVVAEFYAALLPRKRDAMTAGIGSPGFMRHDRRGHEDLLEAIERRDPDAAERTARENLEATAVWEAARADG